MKIVKGASIVHTKTDQNIHQPKVEIVSLRGFVLMETIKSETLHAGKPAILEGRSMNTGINISCSGVTARFIDTAIVVIAGLNIETRIVEHKPRVAKVDKAGIGKIPPQNPTAVASPIWAPLSERAGITSFSSSHFRICTMESYAGKNLE